MKRWMVLLLILGVAAAGCGRREPVRVASKTSLENQILGEMFVLLAAERGVPVKRLVPYGNTFDAQEAIKEGRIDVYPEYTGTGASMLGLPTMTDGDRALATVREAFTRFDLRWLDRLGFNNAYSLVMTSDRAAQLEVAAVSELTRLENPVRLGCETEYRARPVDGLPALLRHYGWSPSPEVITSESRQQLYRNLIAERVDVAVVHRTDPQVEEFGLVVLEDNLDFFPVYDAAPLVRREVLADYPQLEEALQALSGRIDAATIRSLNRQVELDGFEPREVAVDFLVKEGLLKKEPPELDQPTAVIAMPPADHRSATLVRALEAVRRALPSRRVELRSSSRPAEALRTGEAFVAAMGAEHFFEVRPGQLPREIPNIEAVAPVAYRMVHLFRRPGDVTGGDRAAESPFAGIEGLGVGPAEGSSHQTARVLLDAYGASDRVSLITGNVDRQASAVKAGRLDALLMMVTPGDAQPTLLLRDYGLELQRLAGWDRQDRQFRYPFFRPARIAPETYPRLKSPIPTISSQLVLAGPRPEGPTIGDGDPMTGLRSQRPPIPPALKRALVEALGETEAIDPSLPGESVGVVRIRREAQPLNPAPELSILNALVLLGLGTFFYFLLRRSRHESESP